MSGRAAGTVLRSAPLVWDTGVFFSLYFLYAWLVVDARLLHHAMGILTPYYCISFQTDGPFLWEHLGRPGGISEYVMRFLSVTYFAGAVGAAIMTLTAWALCAAGEALTRVAGEQRGAAVRYVPALLLVPVYGQYGHPLPTVLPLLVALTGFLLYRRLTLDGPWKAMVWLGFATIAVYYVAGSAWIVFSTLAMIDGFPAGRRKWIAGAALLFAFATPWLVGYLLLRMPLPTAFGKPPREDVTIDAWNSIPALLLCLYYPAWYAGTALFRWRKERETNRRPRRKGRSARPSHANDIWNAGRNLRVRRELRFAALCAVACALAWQTFSWPGKMSLLVDYLCQHERWPEALEAAYRIPQAAHNAKFHRNVMLALYHTGRLGDEMFRFPQTKSPASYDLLDPERDSHSHFQDSRFFLQLGQVNLAEKAAYEALTATGQWPPLLRHLARIHIAKGQPEAARIHLRALRRHAFCRQFAESMLAQLAADASLDSDTELNRIRGCLPRKDQPAIAANKEAMLLGLLEANPDNEMAFEFLMANYLCDLRPDRVVEHLDHFDRFGHTEIPRAIQEAIVIDANQNGRPIPTSDGRLDASTVQRAERFFSILTNSSNQQQAIQAAQGFGLGDSYLVFYCFGVSGL